MRSRARVRRFRRSSAVARSACRCHPSSPRSLVSASWSPYRQRRLLCHPGGVRRPCLRFSLSQYAVRAGACAYGAHLAGEPQRPNPSVDPVPFGHWTLRDKAAQRRSPSTLDLIVMYQPFRQTVLRFGSTALFLSAWCSCLWACSPGPGWDPSVQSRFDAAAYVVHARVLSVEDNSERGTTLANIQVLEVFKGSGPPTKIRSQSKNSCGGVRFVNGEENVFFVTGAGYVNLLTQPISTSLPEVLRQLRTHVRKQ